MRPSDGTRLSTEQIRQAGGGIDAWLRRRSILIVTHTYTTGPAIELRDYLAPRAGVVGYMAHPFPYVEDTRSTFVLYRQGQEVCHTRSAPMAGADLLFYGKDTLLTWLYLLQGKQQYDLAIVADPLNTVAVVPWRRIGLVRRLVYWTIDYTPQRFTNAALNRAYHMFDRLSCYQSDLVWNSSARIVGARERAAVPIPAEHCAPQMTVPDGNHFERTPRRALEDVDRYAVAFLGHLVPNGGTPLLVQCFARVVQAVPQARLHLIGGGPLLETLQSLARDMGVDEKIVFYGHVPDHRDVEDILSRCAIAVAPYAPNEASVSVYSDVGKPKAYLAAGLPVVLTGVPEIATTIALAGAGTLVDYSEASLSEGLIDLLSDDDAFRKARVAAVELGALYSWRSVFEKALGETRVHLFTAQ